MLVKHVEGMVGPEHFRFEEEPAREPNEGEVLVKVDSISIDAFIRTSLNDVEGLHTQVKVGGTVIALGVGRVIESNAPGFAVGDAVSGPLFAQTYAMMPAAMMQKIDDALPLSTYLGALGLTTGLIPNALKSDRWVAVTEAIREKEAPWETMSILASSAARRSMNVTCAPTKTRLSIWRCSCRGWGFSPSPLTHSGRRVSACSGPSEECGTRSAIRRHRRNGFPAS